MDRSFLSDAGVIKASRDFVCIRTATYEDKQEAKFLKKTLFGGGDDLRNFGFSILSPDASRKLKQSNRGPNFAYQDAGQMGADLRRIAKQYSQQKDDAIHGLPQMKNVRLGLNVASCDGLPCIVVHGKDNAEVDRLAKKLDQVIWDDDLMGKFIYASTSNRVDLKPVQGSTRKTGILVIAPNEYGTQGRMIETIGGDVDPSALKQALVKLADNYARPSKSHGSHVRYGRRNGEDWKTEVPVPDRRRGNNRR